jgi:hypothetical protein
MITNILLALIMVIIICGVTIFLFGVSIGLIIMGLKWVFYAGIIIPTYIICAIGRKIRDIIKDRLYPDVGAYKIDFGPINRKGVSKISYKSIR